MNYRVTFDATLTSFRVRERQDGRQQARDGGTAQDLAVVEERVNRDRALAEVHQTLGYPDDKQTVWLLVVVARQLSEHLCQPSIVRARTDQTHCENGVERDGEIIIVAVFGEGVKNGQLWIRSADKTESQWNGFANDGVAVGHLQS
jgi:hypothetical protein